MMVDFRIKTAPSYSVAYLIHLGGYSGENMWRSEFGQLESWTKRRKLRTGKRIMYFIDKWGEKPNRKRRSVAALEIKGKAEPERGIRIMKLPRHKVVSVSFDPNKVSSDLVYHGLESWLESCAYKQTARSRELYNGNPWKDSRAYANCEVQVPIKRK
jgi:effector-binding domain-containing protein